MYNSSALCDLPSLPSPSSVAHAVLLLRHATLLYVSAHLGTPAAIMSPHSPRGNVSHSDELTDDNPFFEEDTHTLNQSESQDNANRLMDDLELLRAERVVSQQENEDAAGRSKSMHRNRRRPEGTPEDVFDTLTAQPQIPQAQPEKQANTFTKFLKTLRRFPRAIRYFVYVGTAPQRLALAPLSLPSFIPSW